MEEEKKDKPEDSAVSDIDRSQMASLEALLFVHGEPMAIKKISTVLTLEKNETENLLKEFSESLKADKRGITILADAPLDIIFSREDWGDKKIQLVTKPEFGGLLEDFVKEELREDLTPASLETLSIIAYLGPISRNKIDYLRGVNSSFILRSLMLRGLIERAPDPETSGAFAYMPSFDLLKHLGVSSKGELPEYDKFSAMMELGNDDQEQDDLVNEPAQ